MRSSSVALILGFAISTSACATKSGTGAATGAIAGGAIGGLVGGEVGLLIGAAAGGALGYTLGRAMEEEDRRRMAYALEANQPAAWRNPQTGYEYRVEPMDTRYEAGRPCREFRVLAEVEGRPDQITGTACRTPDGRWETI
jgi:surface antigen